MKNQVWDAFGDGNFSPLMTKTANATGEKRRTRLFWVFGGGASVASARRKSYREAVPLGKYAPKHDFKIFAMVWLYVYAVYIQLFII